MSRPKLKQTYVFWIASVVMILLSLILPFAYRVDVGPGPDSIRAITWDYIESSWYSGFRLWNPLDVLPYAFLRIVFALYIVRLLFGVTTTRKTFIIGALAELQPLLVSAPLTYLIDWSGDPLVPLYIPIPIMFIIGIVFVFLFRLKYNQM